LQRQRPGAALYETAFNYNHFHVYEGLAGLMDVEVAEPKIFENTNFTFIANFQHAPGANIIGLTLNYDASQLTEEQVGRIAGYYRRTLEAMAEGPDEPCRAQAILSADERERILGEWSSPAERPAGEACVHELVSAQAKVQPEALAIATAGRQMTYRELDERSTQLARHLRRLGLESGSLVAVMMERSPELIVSLLGVLKAGGAYLPLDPDYPADRLAMMMSDSGASLLLTTQAMGRDWGGLTQRVVWLDADWPLIARQSAADIETQSNLTDLAYVIYTSGSTGRPKGVAIEHRGLANLVLWHQQEYGVTAADRASLVASPGFDASVWETWPYLAAGASLHIPDDEVRLSPQRMTTWLAAEGITLAFLPTPLAEAAIEEPWPAEGRLRAMLTGGDRLHRGPSGERPYRLVNHYGPTENTVVSTAGAAPPQHAADGPPANGRPIANTRTYILDRQLEPAPLGTPGELYIGGVGVARGYLRRPALMAERFVPDPFAGQPGVRMYKTGDLARWLPDGQIDFLGRSDAQVKVRGFRIELGEIEAALAAHGSVEQAAATVWPDGKGQQRLAAYVVPRAGAAFSADGLRAHLRRRLPDYMVPPAILAIEAMPLTAHGKVDRKRLPPVDGASLAEAREYVAPRTPHEQLLAEVWSKVLGVERVGVRDNFFELGGDSLSAVRMMAEFEQASGASLPLRALFQYGTVEKLAEAVTAAGQPARPGTLPLVEIKAGVGRPPLFVVHPAEGAVLGYVQLAQRLHEEQPFYALQAPGLEGEAEPLDGVEQMASHYLAAVRKVQPQGPYALAGWSYGGLVAYEMAQQLSAAGERVEWLGLFDSFVLSGAANIPAEVGRQLFAAGARQYLEQLGPGLPIAESELSRHEPSVQVEMILDALAAAGAEMPEPMVRQARNLSRIWAINAAAGGRYVPQPYAGEVHLFRAADDEAAAPPEAADPVAQWSQLADGQLAVHRVPGTHASMMLDPQNAATLAAAVQASLDAARGPRAEA
jgi:amino acid adenylation domain-containing protein